VIVSLVLDPAFDHMNVRVRGSQHLWIVDTPENAEVVRTMRADETGSGVTTFTEGASPEDDFASMLPVLDEHHGSVSGGRIDTVEVFGLPLTDAVEREAADAGYTTADQADGFSLRRK
jgi:hypothetical protein